MIRHVAVTFLVGNSLVIYVITKYHSMRTSTNCLIMNLTFCDLLTTFILSSFFDKELFAGNKWFGEWWEELIVKYSQRLGSLCGFSARFLPSPSQLVAITIDLFLAVTQPLGYELHSKWAVKIGIPVTWLASALLAIKPVMSTHTMVKTERRNALSLTLALRNII